MNYKIKEHLLNLSKGHPLNSLFIQYQDIFGDVYENPTIKYDFLDFLIEIIRSGELKLASYGKFIEGSPEEQIKLIRYAFPQHIDPNDIETDFGNLWWITECPVGAVWIYPDGYEEWT
jgi:hypothetical protein